MYFLYWHCIFDWIVGVPQTICLQSWSTVQTFLPNPNSALGFENSWDQFFLQLDIETCSQFCSQLDDCLLDSNQCYLSANTRRKVLIASLSCWRSPIPIPPRENWVIKSVERLQLNPDNRKKIKTARQKQQKKRSEILNSFSS